MHDPLLGRGHAHQEHLQFLTSFGGDHGGGGGGLKDPLAGAADDAEEVRKNLEQAVKADPEAWMFLMTEVADWANFGALLLTFAAGIYHGHAYRKFVQVHRMIEKAEEDDRLDREEEEEMNRAGGEGGNGNGQARPGTG